MEGSRRQTSSTVEPILTSHCAKIMSKSKRVQQLHVASLMAEDGDGLETGLWLGCCW